MDAVAMAWSELPRELLRRHRLDRLVHFYEGQREVRFYLRARSPRLPIWRDGVLLLCRWGNTRGRSRWLPRTGCLASARLHYPRMELVDIPASLACDGGVWYNLRQGLRGVLLPDERGMAVCYILTEPASHPYKNMTRSLVMPVCVGRDF